MSRTLSSFLSNKTEYVVIAKVRLDLHGLFWFHTLAQPREHYVHISLPLIHNYALELAFLGNPVEEVYTSVAGKPSFRLKPEDIWARHGFYVYPAVGEKLVYRVLTFSMGGTGNVQVKFKTRISAPDITKHQVYLPGSVFVTYIIAKSGDSLPRTRFIRVGAKRFGIFEVRYEKVYHANVESFAEGVVTHPFNIRDCPAIETHEVFRHYAGNIALSGLPKKALKAGDIVLAAPKFLGVGKRWR